MNNVSLWMKAVAQAEMAAHICNRRKGMRKVWVGIDSVLSACSSGQLTLVCLLMVILISAIDFITGSEISISIFFLFPIATATWYGGHRSGIIFSILSATIWFIVDYEERAYLNAVAPYWNALVRFGFFLVTEELLNQLKSVLDAESSLSRTDSLTGLSNLRGFNELAERLFGLSARHNRPVVLAYIDLDNFKKVNDESGHAEGDKVLQLVGNRIRKSLRVSDVAARLGGDEFAILFPETDEAGAGTVINILRNDLTHEMKRHNWPISLSIGVVSIHTPTLSLGEALRLADSLMYQVKKQGRNNILFQHYPAASATAA
jgi:diguanylate cyclase (GGDEF)-like protein